VQLDLSDDQNALLEALQSVVGRSTEPPRCVARFVEDRELESKLTEAGFFSMSANGYNLLDSALVALVLARLPMCLESAMSLLVLPLLPEEYRRPIAVASSYAVPIRLLPGARTLVMDTPGGILVGRPEPGDVSTCEHFFAFPFGRLSGDACGRFVQIGVDTERVRARIRLAIAADIAGALQGALDLTVRYVKERRQFGRAIGSFQAVQHRLAHAAQAVSSAHLLVCRAAYMDAPLDASVALAYSQDCARQLLFDFHQFSGAMGLTLEYPLHLWTYRIRALLSEPGGAVRQASAAANLLWPVERSSQC
jgi:hypothetical protein